ncbi:MAG: hypothetical protein M4579_006701 [Chaenotheca gracillima]|nr:MAG: hypothetical protein M4579_006701 [Chaenotheca gracillima]
MSYSRINTQHESDNESLSDHLSPSDGYFTQRDHPQDMMVPDPSLEESQRQSNKASMAREQTEQGRTSHSDMEPEASESSPLLRFDQNQAPPAYSPPAPGSHRPIDAGLPVGPYPASMGPPNGGAQDPESQGDSKRSKRRCTGRTLKKLMIFSSLIVLVVFGTMFIGRAARHHSAPANGKIEGPGQPIDPSLPNEPTQPDGQKNPETGAPSGPFCRSATNRLTAQPKRYEFDSPKDFGFYVVPEERHGRYQNSIQLTGEIQVLPGRKASSSKDDKISVDLDVRLSDKSLEENISFEQSDTGVTVKVQQETANGGYRDNRPCISMLVKITIPKQARLDDFNLEAWTLTTRFLSGLDFAADNILVSAASGDFYSSTRDVDSRETRIQTTSGDIKGPFNLFDLLSLKSTSGDIDISLTPKPARKGLESTPARLVIETISGDIRSTVSASAKKIPPRDYQTDVSTVSGTVTGDGLLGSRTVLTSSSGDLRLKLLPVSTSDSSAFNTHTQSGDTKIELLEYHGKGAFPTLVSTHQTTSGEVNLRYPSAWEGTMEGHSISGGVKIHGHGVEVDGYNKPWDWFGTNAFKTVTAHRGNGDSKTNAHTVSGSIDIGLD